MSTVIIYKSKYGTTEKYARWLAEDLECDLLKVSDAKANHLAQYDTIIYGGGLYAGGVIGFSFIKKNFEKLKDKKIVLFAVGASTQIEKAAEEVTSRNLTEEMRKSIKVFFLRGGLDYKKMNPLDRFLMFTLKTILRAKKADDADSMGILATYGKTVDFTNRKSIEPIVAFVKGE
ncbi:MAG: flavodoxin [Firmicutes bacterium ADurb.Bin193]|nr:MAG: flavodoxin [Firmicutes bacterium ADurb.Bin193]